MTTDHVFGSDELTPELLRSATFDERDGLIDAEQVREYLDRVASSLEVFMSEDAPTALRAEFSRNAEIAQQILDAGQNASEQLRRQAAEQAKRILDEAREATLGLRETVEAEIGQARTQVEAMRGTFIQDLRDLYDRIGASLYRFERAAEDSAVAPITEPVRARPAAAADDDVEPAPANEPVEEVKPPAWRQLPAEAWSSGEEELAPTLEPEPAAVPEFESGADPAAPFQVFEDEPLAPGEPLVDLNELGESPDPAAPPPSEQSLVEETPGGLWLEEAAATVESAIPPLPQQAVELPPELPEPAAPAAGDLGGSWLESVEVEPTDVPTPATETAPDVAHDDALAEALIGGVDAPPPLPEVAPLGPPPVEPASADAVAVRQQILDLLAAGQSRESVEAYLSNQLGLLNPGVLVDAALGSAPGS